MASSSTGIVATKQLVAHVPGQFDAAFVVSRGDIPAIRNVGDDDVCYQAPPPANTHKMYMCVFDCGPPRAEQLMTNTGTHQNPRWMCKPCNNARKAIEWMANKASDGQLKQTLDEMKKTIQRLGRPRSALCASEIQLNQLVCLAWTTFRRANRPSVHFARRCGKLWALRRKFRSSG